MTPLRNARDYDPYELWHGYALGSIEASFYEALEDAFESETTMHEALKGIREEFMQKAARKKKIVDQCLTQARTLHALGQYGASITRFTTAIELIVRDLLLRPALSGIILHSRLRDELSTYAIQQRKVPRILKALGIDLESIPADDERPLSSLWKQVVDFRDKIVHEGELAEGSSAKALSEDAQECADLFLQECLPAFLKVVGLDPDWL